jgi:hypothetical protein
MLAYLMANHIMIQDLYFASVDDGSPALVLSFSPDPPHAAKNNPNEKIKEQMAIVFFINGKFYFFFAILQSQYTNFYERNHKP